MTTTHDKDLKETVYRHRLGVRICHWINALSFCFLVVSGIAILMAHPELYWGMDGYYGHKAWLTLPFLKTESITSNWGRNYHFLFAWVFLINGFIYVLCNLLNRHFQRDILPTREQLSLKHVMADIRDHLHFRTHKGNITRQYNFLQKFSYLCVIFVLCPIIVLSGLSMSPAIVSVLPELMDMFGGRQSGRSIHFISVALLVLFFVIHLTQVILLGFVNEVKAMVTGRFTLPKESK